MADSDLTFVTVVYEAEFPLLRLQARSMARFLSMEQVRDILVLDNSAKGMPQSERAALMDEYGRLAPRVTVLRPDEVCRTPRGVGWSVQQVLKLAVAARVRTAAYLVLDAKNHFVAPLPTDFFSTADGRLRIPAYSFERHPLRRDLERVLAYLGLDPAPHVARFTATVTPFVLDTGRVRALIADVEARSGRSFAAEFLAHDLTEFFLYSGWIVARGDRLDDVFDLSLPQLPVVWPRAATGEGVRAAVELAEQRKSPLFAVHRRALATLTDEGIGALSVYWTSSGLFGSPEEATAFIADFRRASEVETRAQARRDLPAKLLSAPRKLRRRLRDRLGR
ncbi:MAG TPA: DUF6492 family protein [Naasia sp.]|jgi:hypothetical protein